MTSSPSPSTLRSLFQPSERPVLIEVSHPECTQCQAVRTRIDQLKQRAGSRLTIGHLTVRENREVIEELDVKRVPTLLVFRRGSIVARLHGPRQIQRFSDQVEAEIEPVA